MFTEYVRVTFGEKSEQILEKVDWDRWIFSTGKLFEKVEYSNILLFYYINNLNI